MSQSIYDRESRLLYSCIVAGKSAKFADAAMAKIMACAKEGEGPFDMLRRIESLRAIGTLLRGARTGNYNKLTQCFREIIHAGLDLIKCTPQELEKIHGIGPKTARFFIIWTRPEEEYAALDVHILRWLRDQGYDAPKSTPSGAKYAELEKAFIAEAKKRGMTARQLDHAIWMKGSGYDGDVQPNSI